MTRLCDAQPLTLKMRNPRFKTGSKPTKKRTSVKNNGQNKRAKCLSDFGSSDIEISNNNESLNDAVAYESNNNNEIFSENSNSSYEISTQNFGYLDFSDDSSNELSYIVEQNGEEQQMTDEEKKFLAGVFVSTINP